MAPAAARFPAWHRRRRRSPLNIPRGLSGAVDGYAAGVLHTAVRLGVRGWQLHVLSLLSVCLCLGLWIRAKTVSQEARGNAERRALFVGLWPPTLYLIGESLERH